MAGVVGLHLLRAFVSPPEQYPDLFDLLIAVFGCMHFLAAIAFAYWIQLFGRDEQQSLARLREDKKRK